jgi:hypothetical protein
MKKIVLTYGLIGGGMLVAMMLLTLPFHDQIGFDRAIYVGYTTMVVAFLMVYFGVVSYRDNVAGGTISFGRAFKAGLLISLITMACYVAAWQVIYPVFMSDYLDKYMVHMLEQAKLAGATAEQLAAQEKEMREFGELYNSNPLVNIAFTLLEPLPVAIVFTLVTAGITSRKRTTKEAAETTS